MATPKREEWRRRLALAGARSIGKKDVLCCVGSALQRFHPPGHHGLVEHLEWKWKEVGGKRGEKKGEGREGRRGDSSKPVLPREEIQSWRCVHYILSLSSLSLCLSVTQRLVVGRPWWCVLEVG